MKSTATIGTRLAALRKQQEDLLAQRNRRLERLHQELGFASRAELVKTINSLPDPANTPSASAKPSSRAPAAARKRPTRKARKPRVVITQAIRARVVRLAKGGTNDFEIAHMVGISRPSVQNIKRDAKLTKGRSKPAARKRPTRSKAPAPAPRKTPAEPKARVSPPPTVPSASVHRTAADQSMPPMPPPPLPARPAPVPPATPVSTPEAEPAEVGAAVN